MLVINKRLAIPLREFHFTFSKSSGPGGQNVNKVNTKATLRWAVKSSPSLPDDVRERLKARFPRRINVEGEFVISSQRFRDQGRNVADCLAKLRDLIDQVAVAPKRRKSTKPTRASIRRRIEQKKRQSAKKKSRQRPVRDE